MCNHDLDRYTVFLHIVHGHLYLFDTRMIRRPAVLRTHTVQRAIRFQHLCKAKSDIRFKVAISSLTSVPLKVSTCGPASRQSNACLNPLTCVKLKLIEHLLCPLSAARIPAWVAGTCCLLDDVKKNMSLLTYRNYNSISSNAFFFQCIHEDSCIFE